jgi:YVTN family beta-propeller protein
VVNTATSHVQGSFDLWRGESPATSVKQLLVNPAGNRLYAIVIVPGSRTGSPTFTSIVVFDTITRAEIARLTLGWVGDCTWSPDGTRLLCAVIGSRVAVIDTATNSVTSTIPNTLSSSVVMSPDGRRLYVAQGDDSITVHDGVTYAVLATITLPASGGALHITPDGSRLYTPIGDELGEIDTTTNTVVGMISGIASQSHLVWDIAFARGRAYVVAALGSDPQDTVTVVDVASRSIVQTIAVSNCLAVAAGADESRVFVSGAQGLTAIDTMTNQVVASTALPGGPGQVALPPPIPGRRMYLDRPADGATLAQPFDLGGWAVDVLGFGGGPGIDAVHVWAFPAGGSDPVFVGAAEYFRPRPDVAALFGSTYLNSGYQITVRGLQPGVYTLRASAHSSRTGTFSIARAIMVTISPSVRIVIDTPAPRASVGGVFDIAGWALDRSSLADAGIGAVHVWAYPATGPPVFAGAATLGAPRPDVAAIFGAQFAAPGYTLSVHLGPGAYTLVAYALQIETGTFAAQSSVRVTVTAPRPLVFIDLPAPGASVGTNVRVAGWAIEAGAVTGTGVDVVHVWAYPVAGGAPIFIGQAIYGTGRPDVGALFGARYAPSGFDVTGTLPAGTFNIVAFARSTTTAGFNGVRVVQVTVR